MYLMFTELHNDGVVIQLFLDVSWQLCDASNEWRRCLCTPTNQAFVMGVATAYFLERSGSYSCDFNQGLWQHWQHGAGPLQGVQ